MATAVPKITIRRESDFVDVVPIMLGFHPSDSLVALYLASEGSATSWTVRMVARIDLPEDNQLPTVAGLLTQHLGPSDRVVLVAYSDQQTATTVLNHVQQQMPQHQIHDLLAVAEERIWQIDQDGQAHHASGPPRRVSAEAVLVGIPLPTGDRQLLARSIEPSLSPELLAETVHKVGTILEEGDLLDAVQTTQRLAELSASQWPPLSRDELLHLVASVQAIDARDAAWAAMTRADAEQHAQLWRQAATIIDGPTAFPVLGLLALAGWISGNGALANIALDRASGIDGFDDYTLFGLLAEILDRAIHPDTWEELRPTLAPLGAQNW